MSHDAFWSGKRVLVTGHTGFKGAWLSLWLEALGAEVTGFALAPPTTPSLFALARADRGRELPKRRPDVVAIGAVKPLNPVFQHAAQPRRERRQ